MTKNRWSWAEIDLSAISANVANLKALTKTGTLFMAVVKADGYGHGGVRAARAALGGGADRLGVATVGEGWSCARRASRRRSCCCPSRPRPRSRSCSRTT